MVYYSWIAGIPRRNWAQNRSFLRRTVRIYGAVIHEYGGYSGVMFRLIDVLASLFGLLLGAPLLAILWILGWFDTRAPLFRQERVGRHQKPFVLVKFRTMRLDTASVPTHQADTTDVTSFGKFLRRTKLDELPQLWNVLRGEMSLVGPRLVCSIRKSSCRTNALGVLMSAGITGLAQINKVDMSALLAKIDAEMISTMSVVNYFRYIFLTVAGSRR